MNGMDLKTSSKTAIRRSLAGLSRQTQQFRTNNNCHPRKGGSHGYPLWLRIQVIEHVYDHGVNDAHTHYDISKKTIRRWLRRLAPYQQTGNHERSNLTARDQILLGLCLHLFPRADDEDVCSFIYANGGELYSQQDISSRCNDIRVTRKRASLESSYAYSPRNIIRTRQFWNEGPRVGVHGVPRHRLIDVDEASFCLKKVEKKYGRAFRACRVRDIANYKRGSLTLNLLMAVEPGDPNLAPNQLGSIRFPRVWYKIVDHNVDQFVYAEFLNEICTDIETSPLPNDNERIFLWDNLALHGTAYVSRTLEMRPTRHQFRFLAIPRPPYQPKFAPIEYVFCQIANELSRKTNENDTPIDLRRKLTNICTVVGNEGKLDRTFQHCGYE